MYSVRVMKPADRRDLRFISFCHASVRSSSREERVAEVRWVGGGGGRLEGGREEEEERVEEGEVGEVREGRGWGGWGWGWPSPRSPCGEGEERGGSSGTPSRRWRWWWGWGWGEVRGGWEVKEE